MIKKINKNSGQFYLIAALIIGFILISSFALMNYSVKRDNLEIYDYARELSIEGERVLDYEESSGEDVFDDFAKNYTYYLGLNKEVYFIVGEQGVDLETFRYDGEYKIMLYPEVNGNYLTLNVDGNDFEFELKPGKNFYFVIKDEFNNQDYYVANIE